ncbi:uncharacterized protein LOC110036546 [Phalaenopsis equestris]|uniref:uncharacterized protein LOC110036546 n=1 Tax=Phalaenopsis equestris TaxID=78828 RepID=UPI0009E4D769|nr:uncharacterized protein LOC110036546 [Phalaenopsis equestris]
MVGDTFKDLGAKVALGEQQIDTSLIKEFQTVVEDEWKEMSCSILWDHQQFLHIKLQVGSQSGLATFVYAGCSPSPRKDLWESLLAISSSCNSFWMVGGDFNCTSVPSKKLGGAPPDLNKMNYFNDQSNLACLYDLGFSGPQFTWRRGQTWERLDRIFVNSMWFSEFIHTSVQHLSMTGLDHRPLLMNISASKVKHKPMGDINLNVVEAEKTVAKLEAELESNPKVEKDLLIANENLMNAICMQEDFFAQKAAKTRFCEGDRNSNYFHACIKFRRKCNTIHKIKENDGKWLHSEELIAASAVNYYQTLFKQPSDFRPPIQ